MIVERDRSNSPVLQFELRRLRFTTSFGCSRRRGFIRAARPALDAFDDVLMEAVACQQLGRVSVRSSMLFNPITETERRSNCGRSYATSRLTTDGTQPWQAEA